MIDMNLYVVFYWKVDSSSILRCSASHLAFTSKKWAMWKRQPQTQQRHLCFLFVFLLSLSLSTCLWLISCTPKSYVTIRTQTQKNTNLIWIELPITTTNTNIKREKIIWIESLIKALKMLALDSLQKENRYIYMIIIKHCL